MKTNDSASRNTDETSNPLRPRSLSRRQLMQAGGAAATAFTIVPRHVLGGAGFVAPSEKITLACIGFGTQAIREIGGILASPDVQVVAVCDVEKDGVNYLEWGKNQIRDGIRRLIGNPTWREGSNHVPGGRDVGKEIVETYYAKQRGREHYKGCATYVGLPRAAGQGEGCDRGQGDDAGSHPRGHLDRGPEEGNERDRAQAAGESPAGGQGRHRDGPLEEDRHSLHAGQSKAPVRNRPWT